MTLKEKLELLWKYLLLAVIVFGLFQLGNTRHARVMNHDYSGIPGHGSVWIGDEDCELESMDVNVEIEKLAHGDSAIQVIVNGETLDIKDFDQAGEHVYIKKMKGSGEHKEHKIKVIRKMIEDDE